MQAHGLRLMLHFAWGCYDALSRQEFFPQRDCHVADETEKPPFDNEPPTPLFRPGATTAFRAGLILFGMTLIAAGAVDFAYYHSPYWNRIGLAPAQPVMFSHRHHAGDLRIDCRFCHATVETSAFAGMPTTQTCLGCHSQIFTDTVMLQPVMRSAATGRPLQWSNVTRLPDFVFFNHSIHIAKGVACATCHGSVGDMALTAKAEPLTMRWCLDCHRNPAPHLVPRNEIFAAHQSAAAKMVYIAGKPTPHDWIHYRQLTNCSTCHH